MSETIKEILNEKLKYIPRDIILIIYSYFKDTSNQCELCQKDFGIDSVKYCFNCSKFYCLQCHYVFYKYIYFD